MNNSMIFNPLEEFEKKFSSLHAENTAKRFEELVKQANVDVEKNKETVKQHNFYKENLKKLKKKLNLFRFLRVIMILTIILIVLVVLKITPKIKALRSEIEHADNKIDELYSEALSQMQPLNNLFSSKEALSIIEQTIPLIDFADHFTAEQEIDMKTNYDFGADDSNEYSTLDVLAGNYNGNPFIFENKIKHTMGMETYHGYRTISWTETYINSKGRLSTRTRTQTLHATVSKPKPFYNGQIVLSYCAQGGPELCFSRDATHLHEKNERQIERYVKRGEKRLKKKTDDALKENSNFTSMSNSDFEVLFDALDRTNEVQFRTLFTPLAQTNMVDLLLSDTGYGDDFNFIKRNRTNTITSKHSQGRSVNLYGNEICSFDFEEIKSNFINKNAKFFKDVYFDLAPLLAIPIYQERPVHSLDPLPDYTKLYAEKQCESLANVVDYGYVAHPQTKTQAIIKSSFVNSQKGVDKTRVSAYSYDIEKRVDVVSVLGGDGRFHNVNVPWDEYIPLEYHNEFYVAEDSNADGKVLANKNGLSMFIK